MPQPGVEPGLQSSQDCVLSIERLEHRFMQVYETLLKKQAFSCNLQPFSYSIPSK